MGRKRHGKIVGAVDWNPRIIDIQEKIIITVREIAARTSTPVGNLLRDWIVAGAKKEAKRMGMLNLLLTMGASLPYITLYLDCILHITPAR
jgi:hypothetical protein